MRDVIHLTTDPIPLFNFYIKERQNRQYYLNAEMMLYTSWLQTCVAQVSN